MQTPLNSSTPTFPNAWPGNICSQLSVTKGKPSLGVSHSCGASFVPMWKRSRELWPPLRLEVAFAPNHSTFPLAPKGLFEKRSFPLSLLIPTCCGLKEALFISWGVDREAPLNALFP